MTKAITEKNPAPAGTPALKLTDITKSFGPVNAVNNVSLEIPRNQVVGLIGENGAGKSTLLKILSGLHEPDSGVIEVDGKPVKFRRPQDAVAAGFGVVHQEQSLLTNLSVAENIAMNALSSKDNATRYGWYRWGQLNREAADILARVGATIDPRPSSATSPSSTARWSRSPGRCGSTSDARLPDSHPRRADVGAGAQRDRDPGARDRRLKHIGSVIFVSHRLDEVLRICDRIIVMRSGEIVADRPTEGVTEDDLFQLMIGHAAKAKKHAAQARRAARPCSKCPGWPEGQIQGRLVLTAARSLPGHRRHHRLRP